MLLTYNVCNLRSLFRPNLFKFSNFFPVLKRCIAGSDIDIAVDEKEESNYQEIVAHYFTHNLLNNCYVIQPWIKWGFRKMQDTTPEYQLEEAASLIRTLAPWRVYDSVSISLPHFDYKALFGTGNLETLRNYIRRNPEITSVFINISTLTVGQREELESAFRVPIYDRFSIVMLILKKHAISKHAKLQVALAEVLYLQKRQKRIDSSGLPYETRKVMLKKRETKLKLEIEKLRNQRKRTRENRKGKDYPIVAVVGYTNCGKTSLIKALTDDIKLEPKDQLFATLDVTFHAGLLPSKMKVLYVDTVGFISNIPTTLIECFVVTLEDTLYSDVIIHVEDISSPNLLLQRDHVVKTLTDISSKLATGNIMDKVITVGNKCDLIQNHNVDDSVLYVSAKTGFGLKELLKKVEEAVVKNTGRCIVTLRVQIGGDEERWLYKNAIVIDSQYEEEMGLQDMKVIIVPARLEQFKHYYIKGRKK